MKVQSSDALRLVVEHLGGADWQVRSFGAGKFSQTFSAESSNGSYVLRIAPPPDTPVMANPCSESMSSRSARNLRRSRYIAQSFVP